MKCRLKPIRNPEGIRKWCGPAAISIITGNRVAYAAGKFAKLKYGKFRPKMVRGVGNFDMLYVLDWMGYETVRLHDKDAKRQTLGAWINTYSSRYHRAICLVNVTNHYVVTHMGQVADNHKPKGCPVGEHPSRRCKIKAVWIVAKRKST